VKIQHAVSGCTLKKKGPDRSGPLRFLDGLGPVRSIQLAFQLAAQGALGHQANFKEVPGS
jgi:hypothetical protein